MYRHYMIDMRNIIFCSKMTIVLALSILTVTSCCKKLNPDGLGHFDEDGAYLEKNTNFQICPTNKYKVLC